MTYTASTRTITNSELAHTSADVGKVAQFVGSDGADYFSAIASVPSAASIVLAEGTYLPDADMTITGLVLVSGSQPAIATGSGWIFTREQAKVLLQIDASDTTKDALIDAILVSMHDEIRDELNNDFLVPSVRVTSDTLAFTVSGDTYTITDNAEDFVAAGFIPGLALVRGSVLNDGLVSISSVTEHALTLANELNAESAGADIVLTRVMFPRAMQMPAAVLLKYHMDQHGKLESSETTPGVQGGPNVSYRKREEIMQGFRAWRKMPGTRSVL